MRENIVYREMKVGEETIVNKLILEVFNKFIAQYYSEDGISNFYDYVNVDNMKARLKKGSFILVACDGDSIIGAIELRDDDHISQLFVHHKYHERGIAKRLVELSIAKARRNNVFIKKIGVYASPYAVGFYKRLGFVPLSEQLQKGGARFTPMILCLEYIDY